mmetsp:Transcript_63899/g.178800  ORF Transcript_63899/g.178800 Transcript_63899/m.178800 type:complete len:249 (+) Transcript_63899:341-1087(+)
MRQQPPGCMAKVEMQAFAGVAVDGTSPAARWTTACFSSWPRTPPWVTTTTVERPASVACRQASSKHATARWRTSSMDSPPSMTLAATSSGTAGAAQCWLNVAQSSACCRAASSLRKPSKTPKSHSLRRASRRTSPGSRPNAAAMAEAVQEARLSSLDQISGSEAAAPEAKRAANASAHFSAWRRPLSFSAVSVRPCTRSSLFHSVSPCRTTMSSQAEPGEGGTAPGGKATGDITAKRSGTEMVQLNRC